MPRRDDVELADLNSYVNGFPSVAAKIALDKDKTTTIYRRFDRLSARNLLFLQAELAGLEALQDRYDAEDLARGDFETKRCQIDYAAFMENTELDRNGIPLMPREREKWELALKIREKLGEYHNALAVHHTLLNLPQPSSGTVRALRDWFFNNVDGRKDNSPQLASHSANIFDDPLDLLALRTPANQDPLTRFVRNYFGIFFMTSARDGSSAYISERGIGYFADVVSAILAATLLLGAIISLRVVTSQQVLLGLLSGWTVLFAACVGLLTNARRDQILAATAAYAAVLVVFVSGNLGNQTDVSHP